MNKEMMMDHERDLSFFLSLAAKDKIALKTLSWEYGKGLRDGHYIACHTAISLLLSKLCSQYHKKYWFKEDDRRVAYIARRIQSLIMEESNHG